MEDGWFERLETRLRLCAPAQKVAIQLSDRFIGSFLPSFPNLKSKFPSLDFFLLSEASYTWHCIDFVAARHVNADLIVSFSSPCECSRQQDIPVFYCGSSVHSKQPFDQRQLSRRYGIIEKARSIGTFGIVAADLSQHYTAPMTLLLAKAMRLLGKTYYLLSIGKLSEPKLGNFGDIGAFIIVGCPQAQPQTTFPNLVVLSPYEFYISISEDEKYWTEGYPPSLEETCARLDAFLLTLSDSDETEDVSHSKALMDIQNQRQLQSVSFLSQRTFQGLSLNTDDRDLEIHIGRTGIASSYEEEPRESKRIE